MSGSDSDSSSEADLTSSPVLDWYTKLYSRRVDIVGDYAGNELFLIEGDSVLLHCFSDKHIDFDPGFQLLHATYTAEHFLRGLVARRCNFHIAFFDQHRELCVPPFVSDSNREKYLLAREAIIRHLRANLKSVHTDIEVHLFPSVRSTSFAKYVATTDLYFIMCHDGATDRSLRKRNILAKDLNALDDEDHDGVEAELRAKVMFRLLIYWFMERGYNAALVNGLEWRDTKVVTSILENSRRHLADITSSMRNTIDDTKSNGEIANSRGRTILEKIHSGLGTQLTEREYVAVVIVSKLASQDPTMIELASAFFRHLALLAKLSLADRLVDISEGSEQMETFLSRFSVGAKTVVGSKTWSSDVEGLSAGCDVGDMVDGRLFAACIQDKSLGNGDRNELLIKAVQAFGNSQLPTATSTADSSSFLKDHQIQSTSSTYAVLPFSNEVFERHLAPIELAVDKSGESIDSTSAHIFREVSHWHNHKRPIDPKLRDEQMAKSAKQKFFANRRNQWFMAEMMAYAASLTNAIGKTLDPEIITSGAKAKSSAPAPSDKKSRKEENVKPNPKSKFAPKPAKKLTKKEQMMLDIAAQKGKKDEVSSEKYVQAWRVTLSGLEKEPVQVAKYQKAKQQLLTLRNDLQRDTLEAEMRLYLLNILLTMWISQCKGTGKDKSLHLAALIFDTVGSFSKLKVPIIKTIKDCLDTTVKLLELPKLAAVTSDGDRALSFTFVLISPPNVDIAIPLPAKQFQLLHCGPYFERSIDSAPDPRTPFEPDAWQRQVLDEIDAKRSLLVVAPTSAGKTFISFYAMKQVLESTNDDILVYVAPTKALVNQIAAEVQARFSKRYEYGGNSVWGIHTRDYRINNPTGCQILVTVPHILQIMLLAPSNAKSWAERVKWIIFDEVHCIGQAEDGLIWEQLLLLAPCPIIALSATIGNPNEFSAWLQSTQKAIGNELTMVQHPHRYSDLRKFIYNPPKDFKFQGLPEDRVFGELGLDSASDFTFMHPVASLVNRGRGMPDDWSLEPRDCLTLWQSMSKHQTPEYPVDKTLDPANSLPAVIKKIDIIKWTESLKAVLRQWLADGNSPFDAVYSELSKGVALKDAPAIAEAEESEDDDEEGSIEIEVEAEAGHNINNILPMLTKLHEQDALPGIIFNYERGVCERILRVLMQQLIDAETHWKESSPKWENKLKSWEAWKLAMAKMQKSHRPEKVSKKKGGGGDDEVLSKADLQRDAASSEASPFASFDPQDPVEGFHFADNKKASKDEFAKLVKELIRREVSPWLIDGLRRGIGVHHAGMNRKYRQVVEMLFRKGFLRVVVATGTLALGINMPCKTVVFSGDSVFLSALNYRQAAGRAGRRGFDMLGNVVFHGISMGKIHRLVSSRLPDLNGHFPITTTLVLRLFTLLHESKQSPFAIRSVNALLSQPRLYLGGEESKMTVLHHLRFSIEYLRRQYLLDSRGAPLNFAGSVSHLYFAENSAFAFHALLKDGFFHELCADIDKSQDSVLRELMLTMSHLFGRRHCRMADEEYVKQVIKKSPSIVFLPPMPKNAANSLRRHNEATLEIFTAYVRTFVEEHLNKPDDALPLTNIKIGPSTPSDTQSSTQNRPPTTVRSPFVALSGHNDDFTSIHDLCSTTRSGVFLEEAVVPYVAMYPEESELPLNAYLYDFFNHGDVRALAVANRIRAGDVWFVLNDFSMVLATIVTSLSNFMNLSTEGMDFTDVKGEGDEEEERQDDQFVPEDSGYETASTASGMAGGRGTATQQQQLALQPKKKKKVADSWDDDADEEDFQASLAEEKERKRKEVEAMAGDKPAWEEGAGLLNVLKAFKLLREDFDTKFRAMWA